MDDASMVVDYSKFPRRSHNDSYTWSGVDGLFFVSRPVAKVKPPVTVEPVRRPCSHPIEFERRPDAYSPHKPTLTPTHAHILPAFSRPFAASSNLADSRQISPNLA